MNADWLAPLPDAAAMRATDRWAIEELGIPSLDLMERAGRGLAELAEATARAEGPYVVVCGKGNNGGDGYVAARLLRDWGHTVHVLTVAPPDDLTGDARRNAERLPGEPPQPLTGKGLAGAAVVLDCLLGTGVSGAPRAPFDAAIAAIAAAGVPVVAADVPSGVDASTGEIAGAAVRAAATATFAAGKPGLWIEPGRSHSGAIHVIDIGIPDGAPAPVHAGLLVDGPLLASLPARPTGATKFTSGAVLVAGGSAGLTGAPCLAAEAAMRAGAGYVTACVPASVQPVVAAHLLEVMSRALPDEGGEHTAAGGEPLAGLVPQAGALVLGPGLGRGEGARAFARRAALQSDVPLVLDADGLFAFNGDPDALAARTAPAVLTPHEGELGRLLDRPSRDVQAHRLACAREAAARSGAIVVLKGPDTLVARPDGFVAVSPGATPALATAGTGDVLGGVIGALLAQGVDPFTAACSGVRLHARAGILAEHAVGAVGVIASDVIAHLPAARRPG